MTIAITIAGNVSIAAETRRMPNGDPVAQWSVASNQGQSKDPIYMRCTLFGKRAESALPSYLTKGLPVTVIGKLSQSKYKDKTTGEEKSSFEIKVDDVILQGGKRDQEQPKPAPAKQAAQNGAKGGFEDMDDDIPF